MPDGVWTYLAEHREEGRIFDEAMTAFSHATVPAIVEAYDFSRFDRIADIGGGHGHLLRAVLRGGGAPCSFSLPSSRSPPSSLQRGWGFRPAASSTSRFRAAMPTSLWA